VAWSDNLVPVYAVANRLGVSVAFLNLARKSGYRPPCIRNGDGVMYHWPSVEQWAENRELVEPVKLQRALQLVDRARVLLEEQNQRIERLRASQRSIGGSRRSIADAERMQAAFRSTLANLERHVRRISAR